MAGLKGEGGPPGNVNAFKHGLASIQKRREEGVPTRMRKASGSRSSTGLMADRGGADQVSMATRILAEVIASYAAWLMVSTVPSITSSRQFEGQAESKRVEPARRL